MNLYQSFFETALKQGIPRPIIDQMVKIFANDVDFQRATAAGDSVEAFYSEPDDIDSRPELLYATVTAREQTFKYYRFETPDDGMVDYYDENGRSTRKFLIRKPIVAGELRSGFGMRYHPILRYARMHTGVDWANAIGTPILAAGNGAIIKAEFTSGYGRRIEIQHANGYVTTYSHLSGFARGIAPGVRVTQGQVIGYLGQSGLATGPHLHYEVIVNGRFVDPMAIKLARTREFDGKMLAAFKRERDRTDQLMAQAPNAAPPARRREGQLIVALRPRGRRRAEAERGANLVGRDAIAAQLRQRRRGGALRHFRAGHIAHQTVVAIARRRDAEQRLQQAMRARRREQVAAAHDVADALQRVVDDDRQMVARRHVLALQHEVAPRRRLGANDRLARALAIFAPMPVAGRRGERPRHVEAQRGARPGARRAARSAPVSARQVPG